MRKSELVRHIIREHKLLNGEITRDLVTSVMAATGFSRGLALTYVKNNWPKVEVPAVEPADDFGVYAAAFSASPKFKHYSRYSDYA